jgi:hypothetical protein
MQTQQSTLPKIKQLSTEEAEGLMERYSLEIGQKLENNSLIADLFTWGEDGANKLFAFATPMLELGVFNDLVGITNVVFSFGLEANQPTNRPRFTVLIQGRNDNGSIKSAYYQLLGAVPLTNKALLSPTPGTSSGLAVPKFLFDKWTQCWAEISSSSSMYAKLCSINITNGDVVLTKPLEKYIFNIQDVVNTLYPPELTANAALPDLFVCPVGHVATDTNGNANFETTRIGIVIGLAEDNGAAYQFVSSCYDLSKPCPPTC